MLSTMDNMIDDIFHPYFTMYSMEHHSCRKIWLFQQKDPNNDASAVRQLLDFSAQRVVQQANSQLNAKIDSIFYRCDPFWRDIPSAFSALCNTSGLSAGTSAKVIAVSSKESSSLQNISEPISSRQNPDEYPDLPRLLQENKMDIFLTEYNRLMQTALTVENRNIQADIFRYISHTLLSYVEYHGLEQQIEQQFSLLPIRNFDPDKTGAFYDELFRSLIAILSEFPKSEVQRHMDAVSKVQYYIDLHLNKELSLVLLSDIVHLNPSYLSRIFKQAAGQGLLDYILERRMEKAKILLLNEELKINEVASLLGYNSSAAFGRFFKNSTGFTPQEYRQSM